MGNFGYDMLFKGGAALGKGLERGASAYGGGIREAAKAMMQQQQRDEDLEREASRLAIATGAQMGLDDVGVAKLRDAILSGKIGEGEIAGQQPSPQQPQAPMGGGGSGGDVLSMLQQQPEAPGGGLNELESVTGVSPRREAFGADIGDMGYERPGGGIALPRPLPQGQTQGGVAAGSEGIFTQMSRMKKESGAKAEFNKALSATGGDPAQIKMVLETYPQFAKPAHKNLLARKEQEAAAKSGLTERKVATGEAAQKTTASLGWSKQQAAVRKEYDEAKEAGNSQSMNRLRRRWPKLATREEHKANLAMAKSNQEFGVTKKTTDLAHTQSQIDKAKGVGGEADIKKAKGAKGKLFLAFPKDISADAKFQLDAFHDTLAEHVVGGGDSAKIVKTYAQRFADFSGDPERAIQFDEYLKALGDKLAAGKSQTERETIKASIIALENEIIKFEGN